MEKKICKVFRGLCGSTTMLCRPFRLALQTNNSFKCLSCSYRQLSTSYLCSYSSANSLWPSTSTAYYCYNPFDLCIAVLLISLMWKKKQNKTKKKQNKQTKTPLHPHPHTAVFFRREELFLSSFLNPWWKQPDPIASILLPCIRESVSLPSVRSSKGNCCFSLCITSWLVMRTKIMQKYISNMLHFKNMEYL